jgi:hypothetical protein
LTTRMLPASNELEIVMAMRFTLVRWNFGG